MDTSETYIKMCDKAEVTQVGHKFALGDVWTSHKSHLVFSFRPDELEGDYLKPDIWNDSVMSVNPLMVWLPRQDQLQEMVARPEPIDPIFWLLEDFYVFCRKHGEIPNGSMEQLWLAFVMKEKYGKTWDGEAWK